MYTCYPDQRAAIAAVAMQSGSIVWQMDTATPGRFSKQYVVATASVMYDRMAAVVESDNPLQLVRASVFEQVRPDLPCPVYLDVELEECVEVSGVCLLLHHMQQL